MSKPELSTLMTVKEVAEYLKISTQTVRRWARNKFLLHIRVGKGYRIVRDSLPKIPPQQQNFDNTERKDKP